MTYIDIIHDTHDIHHTWNKRFRDPRSMQHDVTARDRGLNLLRMVVRSEGDALIDVRLLDPIDWIIIFLLVLDDGLGSSESLLVDRLAIIRDEEFALVLLVCVKIEMQESPIR